MTPQPSRRRVLSLLWFPFFFVASMSLLFSLSFAHPTPNHLRVAVVAPDVDGRLLTASLRSSDGALDAVPLSDPTGVVADVAAGRLAAAIICQPLPTQDESSGCRVVVASAANRARAAYLSTALSTLVAQDLGTGAAIVDAAPLAPGDSSGAGLFFYAFPLAMVGMVTSIVLLQLAMWSTSRKVLAIAAVGVFSSAVAYAIAVTRDVLPSDPVLLVAGFLLVQVIAWTTTAAATFVRQFLLPFALTFVLVLGVPTSGGTVAADMLPSWLGVLHTGMPLGAFIDLVRSSAYGIGSSGRALAVLLVWLAVGAGVMVCAHRHRQRALSRFSHVAGLRASGTAVPHTLAGRVTTFSGRPVVDASVTVLDESGREVERAVTDPTGQYAVGGVSTGLHHLIATARHCEPAIVTVAVRAGRSVVQHDLRLQDWEDPAGNVAVDQVG